jgi:predicted amidohydrolase
MNIVTAIQFSPLLAKCPSDTKNNIIRSEQYIQKAFEYRTSLIVFPELSFVGNSFLNREEAAAVAEPIYGHTYKYLQKVAIKLSTYIVYGFVEDSDCELYNSAALIGPHGNLLHINRKSNLIGCDFLWAAPGNMEPEISATDIGLISAIVCRDLINKAVSSKSPCSICDIPSNYYLNNPCGVCGDQKTPHTKYVTKNSGVFGGKSVDIVAGVTNWGKGFFPPTTWMDFAEENQCTLVAANRWGTETNKGKYGTFTSDFHQGGSAIIEANGKVHINGLIFNENCVIAAAIEV